MRPPSLELFDTHCHIHESDFALPLADVEQRAIDAGVTRMICVGTDVASSQAAVAFVADRPNAWASVGLHPHDAKLGQEAYEALARLVEANRPEPRPQGSSQIKFVQAQISIWGTPCRRLWRHMFSLVPEGRTWKLSATQHQVMELFHQGKPAVAQLHGSVVGSPASPSSKTTSRHPRFVWNSLDTQGEFSDKPGVERVVLWGGGAGRADASGQNKIIAIGECGLDYFYAHSSKKAQELALRFQIELALQHNLPLIFHVREAFDDFWPIFDSYPNLRGVVHSFTDTAANMDKLLARGLYVGVNGIMTFTKHDWQLNVAKSIPRNRLLLETDAPFLTPSPHRGKVNEPANVRLVAEFVADLRKEPVSELAQYTTHNALTLFFTHKQSKQKN